MSAIAWVGVGHSAQAAMAEQDAEGRFCMRQLARQLAGCGPQVALPAADWPALATEAVQALPPTVPDNALLLLLRQPLLLLAPGSLAHLAAALEAGASSACACDVRQPPYPAWPPDYLTLRGLERYMARLAEQPVLPCSPVQQQPLLLLTRAGALRSGRWMDAAQWVPGAWVHDFAAYRSAARTELLPLLPPGLGQALDVGGGAGGFLAALKQAQPQCQTHLAEQDPNACSLAAAAVDQVWCGDFMTLALPVGRFDLVSLLDALEHTAEPLRWLERVRVLLRPGGSLLLSVPNVGHWSVLADLVEGRWDYVPAGIHCITHLRFFTRQTLLDWLDEAGFTVQQLQAQRIPAPPGFAAGALASWLQPDWDSLETYAFHLLAHPKA